ncbi:cell division protein FtsQ/DivIB [Streptomyces lichenis]|uniref:Cell division protein FtsQ n=1 Tax=Streptomyces lichenis TaxID=2306967 RepID=A0ABT0IGI6_9ACTN|nr:FtsQ-type POTRA domain-containing protein [Streptomyces lichenis]MCK8680442.1 FtsQ-type POTRA domain-containing protein [Streptomyces lichenis]
MAGPTTAERGARRPKKGAAPARPSRPAPRRRLPPARVLLLGLAALALAGGGAWVLYGSSWLRVEATAVSGTRVLTPAQVEAAAGVPEGAPLASVDTEAIAGRLLRKLPRIDTVEVSRSWPDTVELTVTERTPVLLAASRGGYTEIDATGFRYATVKRPPAGVPLLELKAADSASLRRFGREELTVSAVAVAGGLPEAVAKDTRSLRVTSFDAVTLELTRGRRVVWGSAENGEPKSRALTALMKAEPRARTFDVSAPTAPAASRG